MVLDVEGALAEHGLVIMVKIIDPTAASGLSHLKEQCVAQAIEGSVLFEVKGKTFFEGDPGELEQSRKLKE